MSWLSRSLSSRRRQGVLLVAVAATLAAPALAPAEAASPPGFRQVNLVSDVPGLARLTDVRVSNPWGIAIGPTTAVWINNNNTATSEAYSGANGVDPLTLRIAVQTPAQPTGIAFNPTGAFAAHQNGASVGTLFLFNGFDGYTSGWGPTAVPVTSAVTTKFSRDNGYLGMAVATTPDGPRLYAVSVTGRIEVLNGRFQDVSVSGSFSDPAMTGLAPYNVAVFGDRVYVAWFDPSGGPAGGVSVFRFNGSLVRTLSTSKRLVAPWGMAMAPDSWGGFGGSLLVGNVGDGRITALDPMTGAVRGQLKDSTGQPLHNDGLWGLTFGNGVTGTPNDLLFTAGIDHYAHGLFGLIRPN